MKRTYDTGLDYANEFIANYNAMGANAPFKRRRVLATTVVPSALTVAQKREVDREIRRITRRNADKNATNVTFASTAIDAGGIVTSLLSSLSLGDSSIDQFQGEGITPLGLTIRYQWDGSTGDTNNMVRFIVIQYFGTNAASSVSASGYLSNVGSVRAPLSNKEWNFRKNFKILADSGAIQLQQGGGGLGDWFCDKIYVPGKKIRKIFFENDGTIQKNDLAVIAITDSTASGHPTLQFVSQLVFTDNS